MSVDIEHTVIYNEILGPHSDFLIDKTHTVITAGDDGFVAIEQAVEISPGRPRTTRIGLTPPMIAAIVQWAEHRRPQTPRRAGGGE